MNEENCPCGNENDVFVLRKSNLTCDHCDQSWYEYCDGIIGEKDEDGKLLRDNEIEQAWIHMGFEGKRVCSECYFK